MADPLRSGVTLSIVIPAFNVAKYIRQAVESALDQTLRNIEVIVVDDGSTDNTPDILESVRRERSDARVHIVRRENGGLAAARNTGIAQSHGRYIGFLDGDDMWRPEKAERHVAILDSDPSAWVTFSYSLYVDDDGNPTGGFQVPKVLRPSAWNMVMCNYFGNGSTPILRRECFEIAGTFWEELRSAEDYHLWPRILYLTKSRAAIVPEALTVYRLRSTSLSVAYGNFLRNAERATLNLRDLLPEIPRGYFRRAQAEHHRVVAWRALSNGDKRIALRSLGKVFRLYPSLYVVDWRTIAIVFSLAIPSSRRRQLQKFVTTVRMRRANRNLLHSKKRSPK